MNRSESFNLWIESMLPLVCVMGAAALVVYMYFSSDIHPKVAHDQGLRPIATQEVQDYQH